MTERSLHHAFQAWQRIPAFRDHRWGRCRLEICEIAPRFAGLAFYTLGGWSRIKLAPDDNIVGQLTTLLHEMVHIRVGPSKLHAPLWSSLYFEAAQQVTGFLPKKVGRSVLEKDKEVERCFRLSLQRQLRG